MQTQQCVVSTNLILPFGFFKTITTKIKASIRLGAGGKISQVKRKKKKRERTCIDINRVVIFPFQALILNFWILTYTQDPKIADWIAIKTIRRNGWFSIVLSAGFWYRTQVALRSLEPYRINLKKMKREYISIEYRAQLHFPLCHKAFYQKILVKKKWEGIPYEDI